MSLYTVTSIPLAPVAGYHGGTGTHQNSNWVVVPASVPGSGKLQFTGAWVQVTTMLFQLDANVVPNWFGVAIPHGVTDFTKPHIFFHPSPGQAHYKDSDYPTKAGLWPDLFYYMERLGYQLDGAARNQIIIMPFLTSAATDTGIFAANWQDIVTDILTQVRSALGADDGSTLLISQLAVSSYSVGIVYSASFRARAANLEPAMIEVWDFDGLASSSPKLSRDLVPTSQYGVIKYDQVPASGPANFHVPQARWSDYVVPPQNFGDTHALVRDFMFLHAASISTLGEAITGGVGASGSTGTTTSTGATGSTGTTPSTGTSGSTGSSGTSGTTGASGTTGSNSTSGSTGTTGASGTSGTSGTSGSTGSVPSTGATGTTGSTGTTGTTGITPPPYPPEEPPPFARPQYPMPPAPPKSPPQPPHQPQPPTQPPAYPPPVAPSPQAPQAPSAPSIQPPPSTIQLPVAGPHGDGCRCGCQGITAIVANVAVVSNTAITALISITGIAATRRKR